MTFLFKMLTTARRQGKTEAMRKKAISFRNGAEVLFKDGSELGLLIGEPTIIKTERVGTFTCAICGNTYGKDILLDREAEDMIHKANFGESLTEDAKEVCGECYEIVKEKFKQKAGIN